MLRLMAVTLVASFLSVGCVGYTRHTPDEVRNAVLRAGVIGQYPTDVITKLRAIRLSRNDSLVVDDQLDEEKRLVTASVLNARRTWFSRWSVNVFVSFDTEGKATKLDVHYSVDNPM